jgi:hypothetical protein
VADVNLNKVFTFYEEVPISDTLKSFISPDENVCFVVKTIRDMAVFTDKRILVADKQGLLGKKTEYFSIPLKAIITYAIETAGTFDFDSEIKLMVSGGVTIELKFMKGSNMDSLLLKVYHLINDFMLK